MTVALATRPAKVGSEAKHWQPLDGMILLGLVTVALALGLFQLGDPALWKDEAVGASHMLDALPQFWTTVMIRDTNMILYYFVLYGWTHLTAAFGVMPSESLLRLPSVLFSGLSVAMTYLLGQRFMSRTAGLVGAALYVFNTARLTGAQEVRSYPLFLLFVCISWYALFSLLDGESERVWWPCFVAANVLGEYAHLINVLNVAAQGVAFVAVAVAPGPWRDTARSRLRGLLISLVIIGAVILQLYELIKHYNPGAGWLPGGVAGLKDIPHLYLLYLSSGNNVAKYLSLAALIAGGGVAAWSNHMLKTGTRGLAVLAAVDTEKSARASITLCQAASLGIGIASWLIVPVAIAYVSTMVLYHFFSARYMVIILPVLFLLLGIYVAALRSRPAQIVACAGLLCAALIALPGYYTHRQIQDFRTPTSWLVQRYQPGDGIICHFNTATPRPNAPIPTTSGCDNPLFQYYMYLAHANDLYTNALVNSPSTVSLALVPAYAAQHQRVFFVTGDGAGYWDEAEAQVVQSWLASHFELVGHYSSYGTNVWLYVQKAQTA